MSAIIIKQHLTHYEVIGRGQPIVFLHSWLGSWRTWMPAMEMVADRYKAIALDFWGFGDSANRSQATIDDYVDQLIGFLDGLGMLPPHIVGHGLGGVVALRAAAAYPERIGKLLITSTPTVGALLQPLLKPSGLGRLLGRSSQSEAWVKLVRQASNGDATFAEIIEDIEATNSATLQAVLDELSTIDLRPTIAQLRQPLLAVYGARDRILSAEHSQQIADAPGAFRQVLTLPQGGHFTFLDQPTQFNRALLEFISGSDKAIELKEVWKRRVSQREYF
jgi:3-oxoadipate enol-lactonase